MSAKHTPTPWTFGVFKATDDFPSIDQYSCICDPNTMALIATCGPAEDRNSQLNAEFIVRAANSHEALLAAAKLALDDLQLISDQNEGSHGRTCDKLIDAIAQAEGARP